MEVNMQAEDLLTSASDHRYSSPKYHEIPQAHTANRVDTKPKHDLLFAARLNAEPRALGGMGK